MVKYQTELYTRDIEIVDDLNTPEIEKIFTEFNDKFTAKVDTSISNFKSTFIAEISKIYAEIDGKLTAEAEKIKARDDDFTEEAQKILSMAEKRFNLEEMCLHVAMEIRELGGNIKKVTVQENAGSVGVTGLLEAPPAETTEVPIEEGVTGLDAGGDVSNKSILSDVLVFDERDDRLHLRKWKIDWFTKKITEKFFTTDLQGETSSLLRNRILKKDTIMSATFNCIISGDEKEKENSKLDLYKLNFPLSQLRGFEPNLMKLREPWKPIETLLSFEFRPFVEKNIHLVVTPAHWMEVNFRFFTDINDIEHQLLKIKIEDTSTHEVKDADNDYDLTKIVWTDNFRVYVNVELTVL
ncbi:hypothetical protein GLOIN_2v1696169 [Rhizophagus clarus]|uniref:Uncharacterized protein n=1 Tax=Rhizophagus clarus TaxID=94130 RepID=A0A8H3KT39_9GLOM|nr:hypothetical protein GLOIN_2v1696169 [Rhizophagus clarus]